MGAAMDRGRGGRVGDEGSEGRSRRRSGGSMKSRAAVAQQTLARAGYRGEEQFARGERKGDERSSSCGVPLWRRPWGSAAAA